MLVAPKLTQVDFRFDGRKIEFHSIEKDALELATLTANKGSKIAIFYPSETYDCLLPFCLELLYQGRFMRKEKRSVILFAGRLAPKLRDLYLYLNYGPESIASSLFGLSYLTRHGISSIKPVGLKKLVPDRFIISNNYSVLPQQSLAKDVNSAIIIAPAHGMTFRILKDIKWGDENGIGNRVLFDNFPTYRKLKLYTSLGFAIYGWETCDIESRTDENNNTTPFSNSKSLSTFGHSSQITVIDAIDHETDKQLEGLSQAIEKLRKFSDDADNNPTEYIIFREASYILRRLESLTVPLYDYDQSDIQTFRLGLIERINSIIELCDNIGTKAPAEINEIKVYLSEARSHLTSRNPKFSCLLNEIGECINRNEKAILFLGSDQDKFAFLKVLEKRNRHIAQQIPNSNIVFETLYCNYKKYVGKDFDRAIFCTYLPLSRNRLIDKIQAKEKKMILYTIEKRTFNFFNKLRTKFEQVFFTAAAREDLRQFLMSPDESYKQKSIKFIGELEKDVDELKHVSEEKPTSIISLFTDTEDLVEPEPVFYDKVHLEGEESGKKLFIDGMAIGLYEAGTLLTKSERTVQVVTESDEVRYKKAAELKIGDQLLLINRQTKKTLNELILEKANEYPKLQIIKMLVDIWVSELRKGMRTNNDSDLSLLRKLQESGSRIKHDGTIKLWCEGYVIGPRDRDDVIRIADAYSSASIRANYKGINTSIKNLRGLRRSIVRRLKNALVEGEIDEIEKLGVNIDDFEQYVEMFEVASIEKRNNISVARLDTVDGTYEL